MKVAFNIEIVQKGKWDIASVPEWDFITRGATSEEAKKNIWERMDIQFEAMKK
jgi:hypothetical protein